MPHRTETPGAQGHGQHCIKDHRMDGERSELIDSWVCINLVGPFSADPANYVLRCFEVGKARPPSTA